MANHFLGSISLFTFNSISPFRVVAHTALSSWQSAYNLYISATYSIGVLEHIRSGYAVFVEPSVIVKFAYVGVQKQK